MTDKARDYAFLNNVDLAEHREGLFALIELSCLAMKQARDAGEDDDHEAFKLARLGKKLVLHIKQVSRESRMAEPSGNKMDN